MGKLTEMIIANTDLPLEQKLKWHLQGNHYPPLPMSLVSACLEAIELARLDYYTAEVKLPNGLEYDGSPVMVVGELVSACHLDGFIYTDSEASNGR